jgi:hypothetical protein
MKALQNVSVSSKHLFGMSKAVCAFKAVVDILAVIKCVSKI